MVCLVAGCEKTVRCKGLCPQHYQVHLRRKEPTEADYEKARLRIEADTVWDGDCRVWTAAFIVSSYGLKYGVFQCLQETLVHRVAYKLYKGPIPEGLQVDHLCSNSLCTLPSHLEACTQQENVRRTWERGRGQNKTKMNALEFAEWMTGIPQGA